MPPPLRSGSLVTESELATLAADALDRAGVTRADAARRIGASRAAVTMALDVAKYPDRGHSVRRALLSTFASYAVDGPLYRLRRTGGDESGD